MSIFDDVCNTISKEVGKVQTRSQEMMQQFNLNGQIRDLEKKKSAKLLEIGKAICDKYQRNQEVSEDSLKDKVNEIAGFEHEIELLTAELDGLRAAADPSSSTSQKAEAKAGFTPTPGYECPSCHAPASKDKSFCPSCGETLSAKKEDDTVDVEVDADPDK